MSTNSIIAIERVLVHEGGYVNDPEDPGGETNWGSQSRWPEIAGSMPTWKP